jgi:hypothetical protein
VAGLRTSLGQSLHFQAAPEIFSDQQRSLLFVLLKSLAALAQFLPTAIIEAGLFHVLFTDDRSADTGCHFVLARVAD